MVWHRCLRAHSYAHQLFIECLYLYAKKRSHLTHTHEQLPEIFKFVMKCTLVLVGGDPTADVSGSLHSEAQPLQLALARVCQRLWLLTAFSSPFGQLVRD